MNINNINICIVGLGYVGLPLFVELSKNFNITGYDNNINRINELNLLYDSNNYENNFIFNKNKNMTLTSNVMDVSCCNVFIITLPTPVDIYHVPDFSNLYSALTDISLYLKCGDTLIFESTYFPGATEDVLIPFLENKSNKKWKIDFNVGYSPERINPGDKTNLISNTPKIISGDSSSTLFLLKMIYGSFNSKLCEVESIKIAESAKMIENIQRDVNIALMNEFSIILNKLEIDTKKVLMAAGTKWNFNSYYPGLVGGHCIGVDPYYMSYKSEMLGYNPQIISSSRRINDGMPSYIAKEIIKRLLLISSVNRDTKITILGFTYKENISDTRNSKVYDLYLNLKKFGINLFICDPNVNSDYLFKNYGINNLSISDIPNDNQAIILATPHNCFVDLGINLIINNLKPHSLFVDIKSIYSKQHLIKHGHSYWSL